MTDHGVLFSKPMVLALLAGTKTQTRRTIKPQPAEPVWAMVGWYDRTKPHSPAIVRIKKGDRIWVRESWRAGYGADHYDPALGRPRKPREYPPATTAIEYLATDEGELNGPEHPSIHMPRWVSRLTLSITDVRVERLHDISEEDSVAEGVSAGAMFRLQAGEDRWARRAYQELWDSINGKDAWAKNPWVVAYTFTVEQRNIDK